MSDYKEKEHLHLEYSENNVDVMAVALKVKGKNKWDILFNYEEHNLKTPPSLKMTELGAVVFSVYKENEAHSKFIRWASKNIVPLLMRKKKK